MLSSAGSLTPDNVAGIAADLDGLDRRDSLLEELLVPLYEANTALTRRYPPCCCYGFVQQHQRAASQTPWLHKQRTSVHTRACVCARAARAGRVADS